MKHLPTIQFLEKHFVKLRSYIDENGKAGIFYRKEYLKLADFFKICGLGYLICLHFNSQKQIF